MNPLDPVSKSLHQNRFVLATCLLLLCNFVAGSFINGGGLAGFSPFESQSALAQEKKIEVIHKPLSPKNLPTAAATMPIVIELRNTKSVDRKIRLVGTRDGKLLDIVFPPGTLNISDIATYKLDIPAPIAAMSYQFVIHQLDGSLTTTARYVVKRPCIQTFKIDDTENQKDGAFKREVGTLVSKSRTLEQETTNLETAQKLLEEIKTNLP